MNQFDATLASSENSTTDVEVSKLIFVEDSEYEFVGGGNAVNGY